MVLTDVAVTRFRYPNRFCILPYFSFRQCGEVRRSFFTRCVLHSDSPGYNHSYLLGVLTLSLPRLYSNLILYFAMLRKAGSQRFPRTYYVPLHFAVVERSKRNVNNNNYAHRKSLSISKPLVSGLYVCSGHPFYLLYDPSIVTDNYTRKSDSQRDLFIKRNGCSRFFDSRADLSLSADSTWWVSCDVAQHLGGRRRSKTVWTKIISTSPSLERLRV